MPEAGCGAAGWSLGDRGLSARKYPSGFCIAGGGDGHGRYLRRSEWWVTSLLGRQDLCRSGERIEGSGTSATGGGRDGGSIAVKQASDDLRLRGPRSNRLLVTATVWPTAPSPSELLISCAERQLRRAVRPPRPGDGSQSSPTSPARACERCCGTRLRLQRFRRVCRPRKGSGLPAPRQVSDQTRTGSTQPTEPAARQLELRSGHPCIRQICRGHCLR